MKFGICSEIFKDWNDIGRTIDYVKDIGYDGLEVAPFTLAPRVTQIPDQVRREIVTRAEQAGLDILGIHWVLVGPDDVYINHPDAATRERTVQYLIDLAQFCGDIGGRVIVFGSPKQRNVMDPLTYDQAFDYTRAAFERVMPTCEERGVTICMEPLTHLETNFCQSAEETVKLIEAVNHPCFRLLLDTKAMTFERDSRATLIRRYAKYLRHYHANDENMNGPGWGDVDFRPVFEALREIDYQHYVSVEVFKFEPGPEAIAAKSLDYMKAAAGL
ncbi:MAG TPA: sugar phosphate isomerase/epimerase family protein [Candidatus Hydrogenedentes bacterium]|nr:sugar phosphate isomerase/epimerase family protein [Candidatus Hydrogenedentota bacterium]HPG66320.1 sugar phosphate isomerase/epimerase family protein [Candidatus Hydrogenedentota bacterium]